MGYAILRMAPRNISGTRAMLMHALREVDVPNADCGTGPPEFLAGYRSSGAALAALRQMVEDCKAAGRWQKSIKPVVDVLVTFSRDDGERLDKQQQDRYFRDALDFLNARYGAENVLCAAIHRDETTNHLQVLIAARQAGSRLSSSKLMGNRDAMSGLQDDFYEAVGKPFGLLRGVKRTKAKHVPVRALYAAMNAGAEPPSFRPVPPELTIGERLRLNGYQKEQRERERQQAIEHNNQQRELLASQAADGRKLHPSVIAKQATRYRAAVQQADSAQKEAQEAALKVQQAAQELRGAQNQLRAMEGYLEKADKLLMDKNKELHRIDSDIERLRNLRDEERKEFGSGLD